MAYLLVTLPLGGGGRRHLEVLVEFRLHFSAIFLLGVLRHLEGHLRPLSLLFRLSRGWRLLLGVPRPQGPPGQPGVHGLLGSPLAHLFVFLNFNYYS